MTEAFRVCSTCRTPIVYGAKYFRCSVSTCNQKRTALYFCSVPCWDAHVPEARHRDAWAEEAIAPSGPEPETPTVRKIVGTKPAETAAAVSTAEDDADILVVVSRFKKYVTDRSGMNTSAGVMPVLSKHLRALADRAIREAEANGRKTVLDRDVEEAVRRFGRAP